jgi:hypothetical protein
VRTKKKRMRKIVKVFIFKSNNNHGITYESNR